MADHAVTRTGRPIAVAAFEALNIGAVLLEFILAQMREPFEGLFTSALGWRLPFG
jgi:hypothetical protein